VRSVLRVFYLSVILAASGASLASAQTINFNLLVTPASGNPQTFANGSTVAMVATNINVATTDTVVATYIGSSQATIPAAPQVVGSTAITVTVPASETFPLVLTRGQKLTFTITYTPTTSTAVSAQVTVPYTEPGTTTAVVENQISLLFEGFTPSFTLSYYIIPATNTTPNVLPIASGGTIPFPATQINSTTTGGLQINNVGSGPGAVTGITLVSGGPVFQLAGVPLISPAVPYTITPGTNTDPLTIGILYTPTKVETDTGQIMITYQNGSTATINLSGTGATSSYSYTYLSGTTSKPVTTGGTITFPPVTLSTTGTTIPTSSVILTATNKGNASGTINSVNVTGPFQISGLLATPPTLKPGDTESFTITYVPSQVGTQTGTLEVGNDFFTLSGTANQQLSFSYVSSGTSVPVETGGAVVFPAVAVSKSETVMFTVTNSGTSPATISLITTSSPFSVPALSPTTLAAGKSTSFPITFTPVATGPANGVLLINNTQVALVGAGNTPSPIPSYTITGPSGDVSPASQAPISLTLNGSYPADLHGVLTLTTSSTVGTDPSVQFSTGGRTVDFVIPAGSTSANFVGQGPQIFVQTGTVAETVTLTPSFATASGVDLTPTSPTTLEFTIASLAPVLESVQVTGISSNSFTLNIIGYSTTRSLGSLDVTFNAATGYNLATSTYTADLSQPGALWFQSSTGLTFGGQFAITISFTLTGTVPKGQTPIQALASVSTTVSNSIGTSNALQANIQ
jgi:hypothetical protein